jgi:hypothetical protein
MGCESLLQVSCAAGRIAGIRLVVDWGTAGRSLEVCTVAERDSWEGIPRLHVVAVVVEVVVAVAAAVVVGMYSEVLEFRGRAQEMGLDAHDPSIVAGSEGAPDGPEQQMFWPLSRHSRSGG